MNLLTNVLVWVSLWLLHMESRTIYAADVGGYDIHAGTGYCTGYFRRREKVADNYGDFENIDYDAQTYQILTERAIAEKFSVTFGGEAAIIYADDDLTQLMRHGFVASLRYYLLGGTRRSSEGSQTTGVIQHRNYGLSFMLRGGYETVGLGIPGKEDITGTLLHFQGGFDLWRKVTNLWSAGLTVTQSMGAIPMGTYGVRSYETNVLLSGRYFVQ